MSKVFKSADAHSTGPIDYTKLMMHRYEKHLKMLPRQDYDDKQVYSFGLSSQVAPEYSQEVYVKLLK